MSENIPMKYGLKYGTVTSFWGPEVLTCLFYHQLGYHGECALPPTATLGFLKTFIQRTAIVRAMSFINELMV